MLRILVIDDDEGIRILADLALTSEGYEVVTAPNGAVALELLQGTRPDLILLDMKMPVMDGWEFARRYRGLQDQRAPIVVVTAAQDASKRADEVGANGFLAKPFGIDELLQVIDLHIKVA